MDRVREQNERSHSDGTAKSKEWQHIAELIVDEILYHRYIPNKNNLSINDKSMIDSALESIYQYWLRHGVLGVLTDGSYFGGEVTLGDLTITMPTDLIGASKKRPELIIGIIAHLYLKRTSYYCSAI